MPLVLPRLFSWAEEGGSADTSIVVTWHTTDTFCFASFNVLSYNAMFECFIHGEICTSVLRVEIQFSIET